MSDNSALSTPSSPQGDEIRAIDRSLNVPAGSSKTQVVQLDVGGQNAESLVTASWGGLPTASPDLVDTLNQILMTLQSINMLLSKLADDYEDPSEMSGL